jgi:hypothetical protein
VSVDVTYSAYNRGTEPVTVLNFELPPTDWKIAAAIPPKTVSEKLD